MTPIWGIHNNAPSLDFVGDGFVAIGWDELGDLSAAVYDKDALKQRVAAAYPDAKPGAIPVWAGVALRFASEIQVGDFVIYPYKPDSTLNFGRIESDYYFDAAESEHRSRRKVKWLRTDVPRAQFSKAARYEVGSAVTLFRVKNNAPEFEAFMAGGDPPQAQLLKPELIPAEQATAIAEDEPNADRIDAYSRDFVIESLMSQMSGIHFEHFVADLLRAMGYRTQVTQASGDGGVDVIAHRDPLGLEPPIIKVQCKRTLGSIGSPDVQKLTGTLAPGGAELGLFVTLGSYSKEAQNLGRTRHDLRLVNGDDLVSLVFEHYDALAPEYRRLLPLRRVYMVDRDPEAG